MCVEIKLHSLYNFNVKKIFVKLLFFLFFASHSYACSLLTVPIETPVSVAQNTFSFLRSYNAEKYGTNVSVKYQKLLTLSGVKQMDLSMQDFTYF